MPNERRAKQQFDRVRDTQCKHTWLIGVCAQCGELQENPANASPGAIYAIAELPEFGYGG